MSQPTWVFTANAKLDSCFVYDDTWAKAKNKQRPFFPSFCTLGNPLIKRRADAGLQPPTLHLIARHRRRITHKALTIRLQNKN